MTNRVDPTESLMEYGFMDVHMDKTMSNLCDMLPASKHIVRLGAHQQINGNTWSFLERSLRTESGSETRIGWHIGKLFRVGTYGKVFTAHRMVVHRRPDGMFDVAQPSHRVVIKQTGVAGYITERTVIAHTSEALLHILAWKVLQTTQIPWGVPRPFEVFGTELKPKSEQWASLSFCMSYVDGDTLNSFLHKQLAIHYNQYETARNFLEIFAQIAYILYPLQHIMRLNHRDLKLDNILLKKLDEKEPSIRLTLGAHTLTTRFKVTLIDFGFACIGCPPEMEEEDVEVDLEDPMMPMTPMTPMTLRTNSESTVRTLSSSSTPYIPSHTSFQASSFFELREVCAKRGRDLAQLLYCVHCFFPLDSLLPPAFSVVKSWLQFTWRHGPVNGLLGFTKKGRPVRPILGVAPTFNTGIYDFLRRPDVDPPACEPATVFSSICEMLAQR